MFNNLLAGKTLSEAESTLKGYGVKEIVVVENDDKRVEHDFDCRLVVKAEVEGEKAVLYVSKFLLRV